MSRRIGPAVVVSVLALTGATPAAAQETEARLQRQIDSLAALAGEARVAAEAARKARDEAELRLAEAELRLDTVRVSGMTIVTPLKDADDARALFGEVWNETFRGYESGALGGRTFTYQRAAYTVDEIPVVGRRQQVVVPPWRSREQAKARVRNEIGRVLAEDLEGTPLGSWLPGTPFSGPDPSDVYRQMVVARSRAVDRCLAGAVPSCTAALGLGPDGHALRVWYTPAERRVRALEAIGTVVGGDPSAAVRPPGSLVPVVRRCLDRSAPDACDPLLAGRLESYKPLSFAVRATLAERALERGGPGAWNRLVRDPSTTPEEALAGAAGVPLDELVADWRSWVVRSRPETQAGLGGDSLLTILWILFFAALATRSTRWRFA